MTTPIACSLVGTAYAQRIGSIASLNAQGLCAQERDGRTLRLSYAPAMSARVRQLVVDESECCAFLTFTVEESDERVSLAIHAPDLSSGELDALFAPFLADTIDTAASASA